MSSLNLKLGFFNKLTGINCDLNFCLNILPPSVGWDIMGYFSEPLTYHILLRNRSYTLNFKFSTFISWSLYLPSHVLIPPLYPSAQSRSNRCPRAQFPFLTVGHMRCNSGMPWLEILGAYPVGWSDLRVCSLCPLFKPFQSGASLSPGCSHFFPVSLCPVSPKTTSLCAGTSRSAQSGGGGPSARTSSAGQKPAGCAGSGLGKFRVWGPLALWDIGHRSVSGPPPSLLSAPRWSDPRWRAGGILRWSGYLFCW